MKVLSRLIGSTFLALMLIFVVMDGAKILSSNTFVLTPVGQVWFDIDQALGTLSLNTFQAIVQRYVHPILWDPVITSFLGLPASLLFLLLGALFLYLGRTRVRERYKHIDDL